jgi:hypothetical protein
MSITENTPLDPPLVLLLINKILIKLFKNLGNSSGVCEGKEYYIS